MKNDKSVEWQKASEKFVEFCETIAALRDPQTGCPWDLQQDHKTLRRYMIEECYEAAQAMSFDDNREICGELGDVLLQVVLNSQIAKQAGTFDLVDVIDGINQKMLHRHPHVFSDGTAETSAEVRSNWEQLKAAEKKYSDKQESGVFTKVAGNMSPLLRAFEIGKLAKKIDFDWSNVEDVLRQLRSEVDELESALKTSRKDSDEVRNELGDVFFSLVQLCRHLDHDPESVALDGCLKFEQRFASLEVHAKAKGLDVRTAGNQKLEQLWLDAKATEKKTK